MQWKSDYSNSNVKNLAALSEVSNGRKKKETNV
jgi:hypothetical protein